MTTKSKYDKNYAVAEVVENLKSVGLPPAWSDEYNRLVVSLTAEVAKGSPVSSETTDTSIINAGVQLEEGREFLAGTAERDENGEIVGFMGLSQNNHPHKFEVGGINLATWCAWDTLFLAPLLNKIANVASNAPGSKTTVEIEVGPSGVKAQEGAVVSFVILEEGDIDLSSLESVWMVFCHQVHFFPSRKEAEEWTQTRDYNFAILSVEDAFEVGQRAFNDILKFA